MLDVPATFSVALWTTNLALPVNGVTAWAANVEAQMAEAAAAGAGLLLMPEYAAEQWLSFAPDRLGPADEVPWMASQAGPALEALRSLPARHGIGLLAGTMPVKVGNGRDGAPPYVNRAHLMLPDGRLITQEKLCLTPPERNPAGWNVAPGRDVTVIEWQGLRLATLVCLDVELPAVAARLAAFELDLLLVPSQTETEAGMNRVFACARARATELYSAVLVVGCVGAAATGRPRVGYVSGAAAYVPSDHALGTTGVWEELPPLRGANGPGPMLIARDLPLGRMRTLRSAGADVWPGAWDAGHVRIVEA